MKKSLKILSVILFIGFFTLFIGKVCEEITLTQENSLSVYKPGIEAIKSLKGTDYVNYIQRVYVDPRQKNRLMILIKPNYWGALTKKDKEKIIKKTSAKWREIYRNSDPDKDLKPEVCFANN